MKPPAEEQFDHHRHSGHGGGHAGGTRRDHVVTSTVIIGVALFLLVGTPYLKHHMSSESAIVNAIGGDGDRDSAREAVRRWLRENGDDPRPHEIRWWPPRELAKPHHERRGAAREAAEDDSRRTEEVAEESPDRVCRLKYRSRNDAGDEITRDDLFVLREGKARLLAKDSSLAIAARRSFPDGEGLP